MKLNTKLLLNHINIVSLGGAVNEAVFGARLSFKVVDSTTTVIAFNLKGIGTEDNVEIGVYILTALSKAVQYAGEVVFAGDPELNMEIVGHKLVFEKGDEAFLFLKADVKLLSTTVANEKEVMDAVAVGETNIVSVQPTTISRWIRAIQTIMPTPDRCTIRFESGKAHVILGTDNEHQIKMFLGTYKGEGTFKIIVAVEYLSKVLATLPLDKEVLIEIRDAKPLIFRFGDYVILLFPKEVKE